MSYTTYKSYPSYLTYFVLFALCAMLFPLAPRSASAAVLSKAPNNLGLVGYWPLNEGVGASAGDFSGKGHQVAWNGTGTHWTDGRHSKAGKFNGSDDYLSVPTTPALDMISTDITTSAWIYITSGAGTFRIILSKMTV